MITLHFLQGTDSSTSGFNHVFLSGAEILWEDDAIGTEVLLQKVAREQRR